VCGGGDWRRFSILVSHRVVEKEFVTPTYILWPSVIEKLFCTFALLEILDLHAM
jgi:hypothetical protein